MPQLTEPEDLPKPCLVRPEVRFHNATIRQTVRITLGSLSFRVRISNTFGIESLEIGSASIALPAAERDKPLPGSSAIRSCTAQTLTFSGSESIIIPPAATALSDPVELFLLPGSVVTITMFLPQGQLGNCVTSHPGSRTQTWVCHGDCTHTLELCMQDVQSVFHWYFITAVEAWQAQNHCAMAIVGDSISDGRESTNNGNNRWPDLLFDRMQQDPETQHIAIANQAAGGNRILTDGLGPNLLSRIDRDVLAQAGIRYVLIFEGLNDIGMSIPTAVEQEKMYQRLVQAYVQLVTRMRTFRIGVFGATITPFWAPCTKKQPYSLPNRECLRQRVNHWIRTSQTFDAVLDFDIELRDPNNPTQLNPLYNSGDYLHPNLEGFRVLAAKFPLKVFFSSTS